MSIRSRNTSGVGILPAMPSRVGVSPARLSGVGGSPAVAPVPTPALTPISKHDALHSEGEVATQIRETRGVQLTGVAIPRNDSHLSLIRSPWCDNLVLHTNRKALSAKLGLEQRPAGEKGILKRQRFLENKAGKFAWGTGQFSSNLYD